MRKSHILKTFQGAESSWGKSHLSMPHFYHSLGVYMLPTKLVSGQFVDYSHIGSDPVWIRTFRYVFFILAHTLPILCILFITSVLDCTYNSFLCFLTTNEDSYKIKHCFELMQTPQITHRRKGLWQGFPCHHTNIR